MRNARSLTTVAPKHSDDQRTTGDVLQTPCAAMANVAALAYDIATQPNILIVKVSYNINCVIHHAPPDCKRTFSQRGMSARIRLLYPNNSCREKNRCMH